MKKWGTLLLAILSDALVDSDR